MKHKPQTPNTCAGCPDSSLIDKGDRAIRVCDLYKRLTGKDIKVPWYGVRSSQCPKKHPPK